MIAAVDSNVIIDILEPDPIHGTHSLQALKRRIREGSVVACEVVWAEVGTAYGHALQQLTDTLDQMGIGYSPMKLEAAIKAAECWYAYRRRPEKKGRIVADFLIGGHALLQCDRLLTRDRGFYLKYFGSLKLVTPGPRQ